MSDPTPESHLVLDPELDGVTAEQLAREQHSEVEFDYLGRACLARPVARRVLDDYRRQRDRLLAERAERSAERNKPGSALSNWACSRFGTRKTSYE